MGYKRFGPLWVTCGGDSAEFMGCTSRLIKMHEIRPAGYVCVLSDKETNGQFVLFW